MLRLRQCQNSGIWKTEENGARKGHAGQDSNNFMLELTLWPAVLYSYIYEFHPPLAVASSWQARHPS